MVFCKRLLQNPVPSHTIIPRGSGTGRVHPNDMWYYVYILKMFNRNQLYVGYTSDLKRRLNEHRSGTVHSTRSDKEKPELIFYEGYRSKKDAVRRERYFKSSKGKQVIRQMLVETLKKVGR